MIKLMGVNDIVEATNIMCSSIDFDHTDIVGYENVLDDSSSDRNEAVWITGLINIVSKQLTNDPNYLAIKYVDEDNRMHGFMTAAVYREAYSNKPVMDVKDMIVDYSLGKKSNAIAVCACFDYMIEHVKVNGGNDWRADSIHSEEYALEYVNFLSKRYNSKIKYGVRGIIDGNANNNYG